MWEELFKAYDCDTIHRAMGIFSSIFVIENRLQTSCEKIQTEISMRQWLLLAMADCCPKERTLTNLGELMGCSRQNVKKLAVQLENKGFVRLQSGENNAVIVEPTDRAAKYATEIGERQTEVLHLLFSDFSEEELKDLYGLYAKLYSGLGRIEKYVRGTDE